MIHTINSWPRRRRPITKETRTMFEKTILNPSKAHRNYRSHIAATTMKVSFAGMHKRPCRMIIYASSSTKTYSQVEGTSYKLSTSQPSAITHTTKSAWVHNEKQRDKNPAVRNAIWILMILIRNHAAENRKLTIMHFPIYGWLGEWKGKDHNFWQRRTFEGFHFPRFGEKLSTVLFGALKRCNVQEASLLAPNIRCSSLESGIDCAPTEQTSGQCGDIPKFFTTSAIQPIRCFRSSAVIKSIVCEGKKRGTCRKY